MKSFIPVFITIQGDLESMIRDVRTSGYKMREDEIICVIGKDADLLNPDKMGEVMNDLANQMISSIVDYIEAQNYFSVVICLNIMSANIASFMIDAIENVRQVIGVGKINFAFCPPHEFGNKISEVTRVLFMTGPYMGGHESAAKLVASYQTSVTDDDGNVKEQVPFGLIPRYISESSFELFSHIIEERSLYKIVSDNKFETIRDKLVIPIHFNEFTPMSGSGWLVDDIIEVALQGGIAVLCGTPEESCLVRFRSPGASILFFNDSVSNIQKKLNERGKVRSIFDNFSTEICYSMVEGIEQADMVYSTTPEDSDNITLRRNLISRIARK